MSAPSPVTTPTPDSQPADPESPLDTGPQTTPAKTWAARLRRWRIPIALLVLLVLAGAVVAVLSPRHNNYQPLDPESVSKDGSKALAQVLGHHDVEVTRATQYDQVREALREDDDATLLIVHPDLLSESFLSEFEPSRLVLVQPNDHNLAALQLPLLTAAVQSPPSVQPDCDWAAARNAGASELDGLGFVPDPDSDLPADRPGWRLDSCYGVATPSGRAAPIVVAERDGREVVLLGSTDVLANESMKDPGHAALGLWTLGAHQHLIWWNVSSFDPALTDGLTAQDPLDLLPSWFATLHVWLFGVAILAVVWRWRRMGRLVPEPLPVVVRSAETARGRAALYRRAGARDRAATVLRADTLRRLARRLGLPASASAIEVIRATSRLTGRPEQDVGFLLAGPPPPDDLRLAQLADSLDLLLARLSDAPPEKNP